MITEGMRNKIKRVEELKVVNTNKTRYRFDPKTNTLYIPISETDFRGMFSYCYHLKKIDLNVNNEIEAAYSMFSGCDNLSEIIFTKKLNLQKANNLYALFYNCKVLYRLDLSNILFATNLYNIASMFSHCISLKEVNFGDNFYSENIEVINSVFNRCYNLETINWQKCQPFNNLIYMKNAFTDCYSLNSVDLRGVDFGKIEPKYLENAFYGTRAELKVFVNSTFRKFA